MMLAQLEDETVAHPEVHRSVCAGLGKVFVAEAFGDSRGTFHGIRPPTRTNPIKNPTPVKYDVQLP